MEKKRGILGSFHIYAFTTSFFWALAYVLTRICAQDLQPIQVGTLRCFAAAITMLIVIFVKRLGLPKPKDLLWFALSGFVGFFVYMLFFNRGCALVTTATGNVVLAMSPIVTALGARVLYGEKLRRLQWLGIAVAFAGVIVLTVISGGLTVNIGLLWLMIAMLIISVYNLLQRYLGQRYPTLTITAYSILFGAIFLCLYSPSAFPAALGAPRKVWLLLIVLGVCCSGLAYCLWTKAFSIADNASSVSNYMSINPFLSAIMGYVLIGDPVESCAIYGGLIIMLGLCLFNFSGAIVRGLERRKAGRAAAPR